MDSTLKALKCAAKELCPLPKGWIVSARLSAALLMLPLDAVRC